MQEYFIRQDGELYSSTGMSSLNDSVELAEEFLASSTAPTTFTVENEDGYLLASASNRRITGAFTKQQWDGNDHAAYVGDVAFDSTDYVLLMKGVDLRGLVDGKDSTDPIGLAHVSWDGPFRVEVVDSIIEYFGVSDLESITDEALAYAKNRLNPQPATEQTLELSIKVRVRIAPGGDLSEFVNALDYSVVSNTVGITVQGTELIAGE